MDTFRHVLVLACGVALIVAGFLGWQTNVAAVVVGLILIGALSGELLVRFAAAARSVAPDKENPND